MTRAEKLRDVKIGLLAVVATLGAVVLLSSLVDGVDSAEVSIVNTTVLPAYDFEKSPRQLSAIAGVKGADDHGLTNAITAKSTLVSFQQEPSIAGIRLSIVGVSYEIGVHPFTVYVDRAYKEGSCERREVLAHENKHVEYFRDNTAAALPAIKAAIEEAVVAPVTGATVEAAKAAGVARVETAADAAYAPFLAEIKRQNAELDSPASYAQTAAQCHNW